MGRRRSTYYLQSGPSIIYCDRIDRGHLNNNRKSFRGSYRPRSEDRGVRKANMIICMHAYLGMVQGDPTAPRCWRACIIMFLCIIRSPSVSTFTCREDVSGRNNENTEGVQKCQKSHLHTYKLYKQMLCVLEGMYMMVINRF